MSKKPESKSKHLRDLIHRRDKVLAVSHPPTAAHARIMEKAGCEALFVGTGGVVGAYTGLADVGTATMSECVMIAGWIADSVSTDIVRAQLWSKADGNARTASPIPAMVFAIASDRRARMSDIPSWHIVGDWFDNCSCAVPCPCTFAQAPDNGFCESVLFWHVREGHYGEVKLDNLSFVRVGRWEGDLWARKATGIAGLYIDDHADDRQMEALPAIIGGRAGGFPGWVNECFADGRQSRGIERANITYEIAPDLGQWGVDVVGKIKAWAKAISGPTSPPGKYPQLINAPGSETGPGPQLVTWGKSTILSVDAHGFKFEYTLNSAKHIPFDWVGP